MKLSNTKALSVGALSLAVLFGATACATDTPDPTMTDPPAVEDVETNEDLTSAKAAEAYQDFLTEIYSLDTDSFTALMDELQTKYGSEEPSDEGKQEVIDAMKAEVPALEFVDVEGLSLDEQAEVYSEVVGGAYMVSSSGVTVTVPEEAVSVTGETATISSSALVFTDSSGETLDMGNTMEEDTIVLVYKNGEWLFSPELTDEAGDSDIPDDALVGPGPDDITNDSENEME